MKYLIYPGFPIAALIAELTAPNHPATLLLWWMIVIFFAAGTLFVILYAIARWIGILD